MPAPAENRPLYFSAFVMNTPSHVIHGLWRDPEAANHEINSLTHWVELARYLDQAGYDQMFFADVTGLRSPWNGSYQLVAEQGMQIPTNDPSVLISALATATTNLGLVYTSSIAQSLPFDFARRISTLDHYTAGRVGWNIVTSFSDNTYRNFGHDKLIEHDLRYEIAEEYVDVAYKLWEGSWDEDALRADKVVGVHADPAKIHKINHVGPHYSVEGPHFVTPSPQRTPVLFQAGASPVGQRFAARNAEGVFISSPDPESARGLINETRSLAADYGRDPFDVKFFQGLSLIVGRTSDEAREKEALMEELVSSKACCATSSVTPASMRVHCRWTLAYPISASSAAFRAGSAGRGKLRVPPSPPSPTWGGPSSGAVESSGRRSRSPTSSRSGATRVSTE